MGLALGTNFKFCTSVAKGLKLKLRKFWGPNPTFEEVTGEKLVGGRGLYFPVFRLNTGKIGTRKTPNTATFHAVILFNLNFGIRNLVLFPSELKR